MMSMLTDILGWISTAVLEESDEDKPQHAVWIDEMPVAVP
jgi:hypothetical protein